MPHLYIFLPLTVQKSVNWNFKHPYFAKKMWGCNSGHSRDCSFLLIILILRTSMFSFVCLHSRILFKIHAFFYALFHLNCILGNCHAKDLKPKVHNRLLNFQKSIHQKPVLIEISPQHQRLKFNQKFSWTCPML